MKPGMVAENAIWLNGEETDEQLRLWKEVELPKNFGNIEKKFGIILGEIWFEEKLPGDERVPEVPDHIHGIDVRLLVASCIVLDYGKPPEPITSFLEDLAFEDLELLRGITRRKHQKSNPGHKKLSDKRCDEVIEAVGPEAAEMVLHDAIKGRLH